MSITWEHPEKPNGIIQRYNIQLNGASRFKNDMGRLDIDSFEPPNWSVYQKNNTRYNQIPANTNYTVITYSHSLSNVISLSLSLSIII